MRITNYKKVEGHETLIRDLDSNAIISTDQEEYNAYMLKKQNAINSSIMLKKNAQDIESLRKEMQEIKSMLSMLIKG
jgi:hypothetical protein